MVSVSIELAGLDAASEAAELRAMLLQRAEAGTRVGPVEVERSAELVIAVVALAVSGVSAAKDLRDWWQSRQSAAPKDHTTGASNGQTRVKVVFDDGTRIELGATDAQELEIEFQKRSQPDR